MSSKFQRNRANFFFHFFLVLNSFRFLLRIPSTTFPFWPELKQYAANIIGGQNQLNNIETKEKYNWQLTDKKCSFCTPWKEERQSKSQRKMVRRERDRKEGEREGGGSSAEERSAYVEIRDSSLALTQAHTEYSGSQMNEYTRAHWMRQSNKYTAHMCYGSPG